MGSLGVPLALALAILVSYITISSAYEHEENQYALNYGVELSDLEKQLPVKAGLAFGFYSTSCPSVETIVQQRVAAFLKQDGGVAAGALRVFFHDCFVQGCDASLLLQLSSGSELNAIPNQTIRPIALALVADIKANLEAVCKSTVSCSDIVVLAAKYGIIGAGGPTFQVPLGRRDSLTVSQSTSDLPGPFTSFAQQSSIFNQKGLSNTDLVALAGAHTLGIAHCSSFNSRLLPTVDSQLNTSYANYLIGNVCPNLQATGSSGLDFYSPNHFDNQFYKNLPTGGALLASDQNLRQDATAWALVNTFAVNQADFFNQFVTSFVKMSQISVNTGTAGEIRKVCNTTNSGHLGVASSEPEEHVELVLSTPTYVPPRRSGPEVIAMVTDSTEF